MFNGTVAWSNDRLDIRPFLRRLAGHRLGAYADRLSCLGGLAALFFLVQVGTGMMLAVYYVATPAEAHPSVEYMQREVSLGWLIRGLHYWGSSALVVITCLHMLRVFFTGAHKPPRELNWVLGVLLLAVTLAFSFTGHLLPWSQKAYWATFAATNIIGTVPILGDFLLRIARGSLDVTGITLARFYALHALLLPAVMLASLAAHLVIIRRQGTAGPLSRSLSTGEDMSLGPDAGKVRLKDEIELLRNEVSELERMYRTGAAAGDRSMLAGIKLGNEGEQPTVALSSSSNYSYKLLPVAFTALLILIGVVVLFPAPLEEMPKLTSSDRNGAEWYSFFSLSQLWQFLPDNIEVVAVIVLPAILAGLLLLLPFTDRKRGRLRKRPLMTMVMSVVMLAVVLLSVLAATGNYPMNVGGAAAKPPAPKAASPGSMLYSDNCHNCHGPGFQPRVPSARLEQIIAEGIRDKGMPPFAGDLTSDEIHTLAEYVSSSLGAKLFAGFCAGCHGSGVNTSKPSDTLPPYISNGNPGKGMPGYGRMLTAQEIGVLTGYLASDAGKSAGVPNRAAGAGSALFLANCASCHGAKGNQIPKADLSSKAFRDRHDEASIKNLIATGTPNGMPGFREGMGGNLTDEQVSEIASFLRFWGAIPGSLSAGN